MFIEQNEWYNWAEGATPDTTVIEKNPCELHGTLKAITNMSFCLAHAISSTESNRKYEKLYCPFTLHMPSAYKELMSQEITIDHNFQVVLPVLCCGIRNT